MRFILPRVKHGAGYLGRTLSTAHSSGFARLACSLFTRPSANRHFYDFYESIKPDGLGKLTNNHVNACVNCIIITSCVAKNFLTHWSMPFILKIIKILAIY